MANLTKPIALFGGTFDPIHLGHIQIAQDIQTTYALAEVRFIPSSQPVHRETPTASAEQRLAMLTLALENQPLFKIDDSEIQRKGPSYTIDTLELLRKKLPHTPFCFILGLDAWLEFAKWYRYEDILEQAHLIIAMRPDYTLPDTGKIATLLQQHQTNDPAVLKNLLGGKIIFHNTTAIDISATAIRNKLAHGEDVQSLLPQKVFDYIVQQHLYREK